ncbi:SAM-dependent methyltransferase [Leptolyngbya valderiana BDU 20041]|nr:SAM-dependent methyltransferase [Leptolyngbya valderiana BDU 20041]PPT11172.1 putative methyltransferase [Geitlerinema sp. FC II]
MTQTIYPGEVFTNTADFDSGIRQLLPRYDEMLEAVTTCVPSNCQTVLDLGCGTGELSLKILQHCPKAQVLAVDYSPRMVEFARAKVTGAGYGDRWHAIYGDFGDLATPTQDKHTIQSTQACVSSLAIHHLSDEMKLTLFQWIASILEPGGCFWNVDPVLPETPQLAEVYKTVREKWAAQQGTTLEAVRAKIGTSQPQGHSGQDRLATLEAHLEMLKSAGFDAIAVPWKYYGFAIFGGYVGRG